jgi:glycosyltransferase involved in cell wall biosynthesis
VEERRETRDDRVIFLHRTGWAPHKSFGNLLRAVEVLGERHPGKFVVKSACDPRSAFAHRFTESRQDRELLKLPHVEEHLILREFSSNHDAHLEGDAVVMTSALESFSFPLAEAVALGIPVIAANTTLSRELTGGAAYLYEPNSHEGLADGMERVIEGSPPPTPGAEVRARLSWSRHVEGLLVAGHEAAGSSAVSVDPPGAGARRTNVNCRGA